MIHERTVVIVAIEEDESASINSDVGGKAPGKKLKGYGDTIRWSKKMRIDLQRRNILKQRGKLGGNSRWKCSAICQKEKARRWLDVRFDLEGRIKDPLFWNFYFLPVFFLKPGLLEIENNSNFDMEFSCSDSLRSKRSTLRISPVSLLQWHLALILWTKLSFSSGKSSDFDDFKQLSVKPLFWTWSTILYLIIVMIDELYE